MMRKGEQTRERILSTAEALILEKGYSGMSIDDLLDADEVFLTNSSWGVLPVVRVEAETIGSGAVGEVTRKIREAVVG